MAESSAPADSPAPTDLEALLFEWRPVSDEAFTAAYRYQEFLYCMKELTTLLKSGMRN